MEFSELVERAKVIRQQYSQFEQRQYGRTWTDEEIALGFVGDVGDLMKLIQAKNGIRSADDVQSALEHELADCLWSIMILAQEYDIDLEGAFLKTMDSLERRLSMLKDKK